MRKTLGLLMVFCLVLSAGGGQASGLLESLWGTPLPAATESPTPAPSVSPAGAFRFRGSIGWDMSRDLVKALESIPLMGRDNGSWSILVPLSPVEVSKFTADLVYMFYNDQLKMINYSFTQGSESGFQYLTGALDSLYGSHGEPAAEEIVLFIDQIYPGHYQASQLTRRCGWTLGEGTLIFLYSLSETSYEILYVNAAGYTSAYNTTGL